ncbi:hypothetical protein EBT16_02555 [bacterium]|nr:hypothetical protein [bacterium]
MIERLVIGLFLALGLNSFANVPVDELENNAYVQLYEQWLALDHNQVERLKEVKRLAQLKLERGQKLHEQKVVTLEEVQELEVAYNLATLTLQRQQIKINEAQARLSIVKSKVAAGMTDIPICIRPMDAMRE